MSESRADRDVVLVTGASTGIGRCAALHLAERGVRVFAGVRKPADGEALVAAGGDGIEPIMLDVAKEDSIREAVEQLGQQIEGQRLAGLVNNAGIAVGGPQEFLGLDRWRHQFEVNVFGLVDLTQQVLPHLVRSGGRVVNISSIGGRVATPMMAPYNATKFALEAITAALRMELHASGVWAATIQPGMVKTEIWKKADDEFEKYEAMVPVSERPRYDALKATVQKFTAMGPKRGVEPIKVARAIEHALFARRPRTCYPVGPDARMMIIVRWLLPDRALEWLQRLAT